MRSIGLVLTGGSNAKSYWLGRNVIWNVLLKPAPREYGAAREVYIWKHELLFLGVENITPYVLSVSPEMYTAIRHDTFLMLTEYARQVHAQIIPNYHNKFSGAMSEDRRPFLQNAVDNETQYYARSATRWLADDEEGYIVGAYGTGPSDDQELKLLLEILNIQGAERDRIMRDTR